MTNRTFSHNCTATVTIDLDFGKHDKINSLQRQQWHNDKLQRKQDAKLKELVKYNHCCQPNPYNIYIRRKFDSHRRSTTSHASAITLSRTSIHPQTRGARVWSSHSHSQSQASSLKPPLCLASWRIGGWGICHFPAFMADGPSAGPWGINPVSITKHGTLHPGPLYPHIPIPIPVTTHKPSCILYYMHISRFAVGSRCPCYAWDGIEMRPCSSPRQLNRLNAAAVAAC